ncbi:LutC/YkgG family protein [Corynebacterium sphenisci]|uniref:LutC/YkgG family protein n=1 Tax=Corynebacterium sphenisci TaxID=191493 RepID=UPI0026DEC4F7|nr:LUD domain-containing protein [Corynebacterium sphenisci]MDO5731039.1 LUD domain-containing protein [Corynebacterium sphenisci]
MNAKEEILARIRSARAAAAAQDWAGAILDGPRIVPDEPYPVPRDYDAGRPRTPELVELLADRLDDYGAAVLRCGGAPAEIAAAVARALDLVPRRDGAADRPRLRLAPGIDPAWVSGVAAEARPDDPGQDPRELDAVDAVLTSCATVSAETGTIVLDGSPACGRRALTLVPDAHICVVPVARIVHGVPEALAELDPVRPTTFISGPSATSDIELNRVEGVHGPRTLVVILAG